MRKKHKGSSGYIEFTLVFSILAIVIVCVISVYADYNKGLSMNEIMRRHMLVMESQGYLSETEKEALILELEAIGIYNIEFDKDPTIQVEYGAEVILSIRGTTNITQLNVDDTWPMISREEKTFHRQYKTIALY